jgi:hypothetical protein
VHPASGKASNLTTASPPWQLTKPRFTGLLDKFESIGYHCSVV